MESNNLCCKYCSESVEDLTAEGLKCIECNEYVHVNCLKRGSVPGGLFGDIFYTFVCINCTKTDQETFVRDRMPWFQAIVLVLHHINKKNPGLARKGYFHWKMHLATLIDKHWDIIFPKDFKRKKKWIGTVSGTLSHYSPHFFHSGTAIFGEQGWWTLTFPKLTPNTIMKINSEFLLRKQKSKGSPSATSDFNIVNDIIKLKILTTDFQQSVFDNITVDQNEEIVIDETPINVTSYSDGSESAAPINVSNNKLKKILLPTVDSYNECSKKLMKTNAGARKPVADIPIFEVKPTLKEIEEEKIRKVEKISITFMDPMCHYNTSLKKICVNEGLQIRHKIMGNIREDTILSPYSSLYLKPYIRRDVATTPTWLKMMAEVLIKSNKSDSNYVLPARSSVDYVYVQPSHIPAINSLCNQFFWPGIDLTDCLQYPDFSCVVLYKKLIIGFAFIVPDVKIHENYISFVFVRPQWRNCGIGRFMIYHLIQTSMGKDITLHVSINNPALFLYQKFGFKVEHVVQNFYEKYYQKNSKESKHAFFCRLER
ncbi:PREDICTED: cysteine-rich protein 2-binding protein [Nicrophorus vespilloides]|uniref:Cysteine-rich protein 2-binding protein n=1 Tax=Nicrophorus vespilloides TaxID=110193 RepID=A0ABM1NE46_NICVS|nr:PREDICTED: cysteine-rich protein 2-binding protein [Nicrophorus vespilloides]